MRAKVDKDTCIGCETCPAVCPEVFSMDDDGKAVAISTDIPEELQASAQEGRDSCPVDAIDIE